MNSSLRSALLLTACSLGLGCHGDTGKADTLTDSDETGQPEAGPEEELEPRVLDPFRLLRITPLTEAVNPVRLAIDPSASVGLVLDPGASMVWGTDALFLHDPSTVCINNEAVRESQSPGPSGACPDNTIATSRGALPTEAAPIAISITPNGGKAAILDAHGRVYWVHTDPLGAPAQDHMRPLPAFILDTIHGVPESARIALTADALAVAQGTKLWIYTHDGDELSHFETTQNITDIAHSDAGWWAISATETILNGAVVASGGLSFAKIDGKLWAVSPAALTPLEETHEAQALSGATGPAVQWGDQILFATSDGLQTLNGQNSGLLWDGVVTALQVNDAEELVVLDGEGALRIYVDETRYPADTTLHAWISTFIEKPRKFADRTPCRGEGETIQKILEQAHTNAAMLQDLPATVALGITPSHWARAIECDEQDAIERLAGAFELGVLFHDAPSECAGDETCYQSALAEQMDAFTLVPQWVSGLGAHTELGVDWVAALRAIGAPNRFSFFGMSMRPDIDHATDLRAKDSWPSSLERLSQVWQTDDVDSILNREGEGWLQILPGDNIPAFNLGACANLFINECHPLGRGDGGAIEAHDIESLDLLLHRALASAHHGGTHTWNFHLPDIGLYAYTDECTETDGLWSGDNCEGARLQEWLSDVSQRFASNGLLIWSTPASVVLP